MAELTAGLPASSACCPPSAQAGCCEPAESAASGLHRVHEHAGAAIARARKPAA